MRAYLLRACLRIIFHACIFARTFGDVCRRYFDELKSLLPPMQDTKFDKNSILVNSITLIKALRTELAAAQTLRCTGAIGDPSQCNQLHRMHLDFFY